MPAEDYAPQTGPLFCPMCGGGLLEQAVPGDHRRRLVCDQCGHIYYLNPKIVAATIPVRDGRVLLARRAIEPRRGFWTFPSGFMELGETAEEAALRETWEEVLVHAELTGLLGVYSRPSAGVVIVVYRARVELGEGAAGDETLEVAWFTPETIPWPDLAFDSTTAALRDWVAQG